MGYYQRNDGPYGSSQNPAPTRENQRPGLQQPGPNGWYAGPQYGQYGQPYARQNPAYAGARPPYPSMPQERPKTSKIPFIVLGVILLLLVGMCVSCSVIAGGTVGKGMQVLSEKQSQWCKTANAKPTANLDSEKAVREAKRLSNEHKGESRWSVCSTLMGEYDEQTATWALKQIEVNWGRNALRYAELNNLKDEDPSDETDKKMITTMLTIAGFTQQEIDYATAHWNETIGEDDTSQQSGNQNDGKDDGQ